MSLQDTAIPSTETKGPLTHAAPLAPPAHLFGFSPCEETTGETEKVAEDQTDAEAELLVTITPSPTANSSADTDDEKEKEKEKEKRCEAQRIPRGIPLLEILSETEADFILDGSFDFPFEDSGDKPRPLKLKPRRMLTQEELDSELSAFDEDISSSNSVEVLL